MALCLPVWRLGAAAQGVGAQAAKRGLVPFPGVSGTGLFAGLACEGVPFCRRAVLFIGSLVERSPQGWLGQDTQAGRRASGQQSVTAQSCAEGGGVMDSAWG